MKIKINIGDTERELDIKLTGKDQKKFLAKIGEIAKKSKEENADPEELLEKSTDFLDYQDNVIIEKAGLTQEELEDLDLEEKNKILKSIREILLPWGKEGFF